MKQAIMKRLIVIGAVLSLSLAIGGSAFAQGFGNSEGPSEPGTGAQGRQHQTKQVAAATSGLLTRAYAALAQADHDYQGHRARAMHQIEMAAKVLGVNVQGTQGNGEEQQGESDGQLHSAQGLLQQAVAGLEGRAKFHIERAIEQIGVALSVK